LAAIRPIAPHCGAVPGSGCVGDRLKEAVLGLCLDIAPELVVIEES